MNMPCTTNATTLRLIAVASERIPDGVAFSRIKTLTDQHGDKWDILRYSSWRKGDMMPSMMLMAAGLEISEEAIWKHYNKSEAIIFAICKPLNLKP